MELARPAYVAVAVRDIMVLFFGSFWRASGGMSLGSDPVFAPHHTPVQGGSGVVVRAASRERPLFEALDRGRR